MKVQKSMMCLLVFMLMLFTVSAESYESGHCDVNLLTGITTISECTSYHIGTPCVSSPYNHCSLTTDGLVDGVCTHWVAHDVNGDLPSNAPQIITYDINESIDFDTIEIYMDRNVPVNSSQDVANYAVSFYINGSWNVYFNVTKPDSLNNVQLCEAGGSNNYCVPYNVAIDTTNIEKIKFEVYDVALTANNPEVPEFMVCKLEEEVVDYSCDSVVYAENFTYGGTFASQGWTHSDNYGGGGESPIDYSYLFAGYDFVMGENNSGLSPTAQFSNFKREIWSNYLNDTSKEIIVKFDYYDGDVNGDINSASFTLTSGLVSNDKFFRLYFKNNSKSWEVENNYNNSGTDCLSQEMTLDEVHEIFLHVDSPNLVYSLYIDGVCGGTCCNQSLGVPKVDMGADGLLLRFDSGADGINKFMDNIEICEGSLEVGEVSPPTSFQIDDVTDYRYNPISLQYDNNIYYKVGSNITYNVTTSGTVLDDYVAVDCSYDGQAPFATAWINDTFTQECTYDTIGDYTARVYATEFGDWSEYGTNYDINISIRECESSSDCDAGEQCLAGTCSPSTNYTFCTDSDGGVNLTGVGTLTTDFVSFTDSCGGFASVNEFYCDNTSDVGYFVTAFGCALNEYCNAGACANISGLGLLTLNVRDYDDSDSLASIDYIIQDLVNETYYTGTVTDSEIISVSNGHEHSMVLTDASNNYKRYEADNVVFGSSYTVLMQKHCSGDCVFEDDFSYGASPFQFGWQSPSFYNVSFHDTYGYMLELDNSVTTSAIYAEFPAPNYGKYTISYDLIMADQIPADTQELWVYIEDSSAVDIALIRYYVDEVNGDRMYYWSSGDWVEVTLANKYLSTATFTTRLDFDTSTGTFDLYYDRTSSSGFQKLVTGATMLNNRKVATIKFDPLGSTYERKMYVDNILIEQEPLSNETTSPLNPSAEDSDVPWYFDSEGNWVFDDTNCGREGAMLCLIKGGFTWLISSFTRWLFTGIHFLYFLIFLLVLFLVAPLYLEWRRQNMGGR